MRNVAIVISDITKSAGTERAVTNLANVLSNESETSVFIISVYSSNGMEAFYQIDDRVTIFHLGKKEKITKFKRLDVYKELYRELSYLILNNNINIIIGTTHAYNIVLSFLPKRIIRIGCEHINYSACPSVVRPIRKWAYKRLDSIVVLTNADAGNYRFIQQKKLHVIPNISSFSRDNVSDLSKKRIITIGRLSMQKGYDILVDVINGIRNEMEEWTVDIFGSGEMRKELANKISSTNLESVIHICNPTSRIKEELLESSIYLMTSRHEGLPMVLIEAQTCGLPIVSFDCPEGPAEIVTTGTDGYLIPLMDKDEMGKKLLSLMYNDQLRTKFGQKAFENSARFSKESIIAQWKELFAQIEGDQL